MVVVDLLRGDGDGGFRARRVRNVPAGAQRVERKRWSRGFQQRTLKKTFKIFERWGFAAIAIPAILPPPMPLVPFLLVAGAMQYSVKKFLLAMTLGRIVRYSILAYLAGRYGRKMLPFLHRAPICRLGVTLGLTAVGAAFTFCFETKKKKRLKAEEELEIWIPM